MESNWFMAFVKLEAVERLGDQHGLDRPPEYWLLSARQLLLFEEYDDAFEAATQYLMLAGRDGERYDQVLRLLNKADEGRRSAEAARKEAEAAKKEAEEEAAAAEEAKKQDEALIAGMEFVWIPAGQFRIGSNFLAPKLRSSCRRRRTAIEKGTNFPRILPSQVQSDCSAVAGGHGPGHRTRATLQLRRVPSNLGELGRHADVHREAEQARGPRALSTPN